MGNITAKLIRPSGVFSTCSDDEIVKVDLFSSTTQIVMARIRYECFDKDDRYEYRLTIDGDLMREIWYWKESKDYDVIIDLIGGKK